MSSRRASILPFESPRPEERHTSKSRSRIVFKQLGGTDFLHCAFEGGNLFLGQIATK
jgi:hypothetical protein